MLPHYRFRLQVGEDIYPVSPLYGSGLSKKFSKESGEYLFRTKLDGKLKFIKSDYALILSKPFDTVYKVLIDIQVDNTWRDYFTGTFARTDCTVDADNQIIEVSLEPEDGYTDILGGLDKEFDLIKLAPEIESLYLYKRPAIQVYVRGTSIITSFVGGTYFEQECSDDIDENTLINKYGFRFSGYFIEISGGYDGDRKITMAYPSLYPYATLFDKSIPPDTGHNIGTVATPDGLYYAKNYYGTNANYVLGIYRASDDALINWQSRYDKPIQSGDYSATGVGYISTPVYVRLLHNKPTLPSGASVITLTSEDIAGNNMNYKYASPLKLNENNIAATAATSTEPTEFGIIQPGIYFKKPYSLYTEQFYPIGKSAWVNASLWYAPSFLDDFFEARNRQAYKLKHAYPLYSCIAVLLNKIAPGLIHTEASSTFLYSDKNPITRDPFKIYLTQKTNILKGEYSQPAQKATVTLKQILDMLKNCFQCYWYIEGNEFRIEHISFFQKGFTYESTPIIGLDLTKVYDNKVKKPWSFGSNKYTYLKAEMPEWYQFRWADDVTEPFNGSAIEIKSNYVEKGNINEVTVSGFTSDVDLMLLNPNSFSSDGLVLLMAVPASILSATSAGNTYLEAQEGKEASRLLSVDASPSGSTAVKIKVKADGLTACSFQLSYYVGSTIKKHSQTITFEGLNTNRYFEIEDTLPAGTTSIGLLSISGRSQVNVYEATYIGVYNLPFVEKQIDTYNYLLQNGLAAFCDLQEKYYVNSLPAGTAIINGQTVYVRPIRRKKQEISFPSDNGTINPYALIKTELGVGQVEDISVNLSSGLAKVTLLYDTE